MSKWEMERDIERLESRLENANEDCKAALETVDALRADLAASEARCRRLEEALEKLLYAYTHNVCDVSASMGAAALLPSPEAKGVDGE